MKNEQENSGRPAAFIPRDRFCRRQVMQEVIVHPDGGIEIPWVTPSAAPLLREVWAAVNGEEAFPVAEGQDDWIYCG
jgi:hypothetical protein